MHCIADAPRSNPTPAIFFFLKNWRDLDFNEQKFPETEKFHVRKVKCLVRATDRKMSVWRMETSDNSHAASFPIKCTIDQPRFQRNVPSTRWYKGRIFWMNDKSGCSSKSVLSSRSLLKVTLWGIFPQENLSISKDHGVNIAEHGNHTSELKMFDLL